MCLVLALAVFSVISRNIYGSPFEYQDLKVVQTQEDHDHQQYRDGVRHVDHVPRSVPGTERWDFFVFTQDWPQSVCIDAIKEGHDCVIPNEVTTWIVHGLWPNLHNTHGPNNCNSSWHFNESQIRPLEPKMDKFWPNLFNDSPKFEFWKHEWEKHGTCCTDLNATHNEFLYFSTALGLQDKYNITRLLVEQGILPGQHYEIDKINTVLQGAFGQSYLLRCSHDKGIQYLNAVELCISKEFRLIKCDENSINSLAAFYRYRRSIRVRHLPHGMTRKPNGAELPSVKVGLPSNRAELPSDKVFGTPVMQSAVVEMTHDAADGTNSEDCRKRGTVYYPPIVHGQAGNYDGAEPEL